MIAEDLKSLSLLLEFDDRDRTALLELLESISLAVGEPLFCEGDEADSIFWVVSGSVRVSSEAIGDLGLVCDGGNLGAISLMTIGSRQASAFADSECQVLQLSRMAFRRLADDFPRTGCRLAEAVVGDLAAQLRDYIERLSSSSS